MINLTPYLLFEGNCAEAMEFYKSCFGGDLIIMKAGDSPMKSQIPAEQYQKVVNAHLKSGLVVFSASDWMHPARKPEQGNLVCMYVNGATYEELRAVFDKLAQGADADLLDDLHDMPFGSYGALTDKYGVRWMFQGQSESALSNDKA